MRWERECEGYINLITYALGLFSTHLVAPGKMLVMYLSERTRMSHIVIEATLIYTLVQFLSIIYLVLGKIVHFFNSFDELTFAAGIYATCIKQKKLHFLSPFTKYLFMVGKFFIYLISSRWSRDFPLSTLSRSSSCTKVNVYIRTYLVSFTTWQKSRQECKPGMIKENTCC